MAGGAAEVHQTPFGQHVEAVATGEGVFVDLGLDVELGHAFGILERIDLDLVVEVTDVTDDGLVLHLLHVLEADDVEVAGGGDVDVAPTEGVLDGEHAEAFHGGLQGTDRIDLGHHNLSTLALEGLSTALADVAVTADHGNLAGDHHVGGTLDAVDQGLAATVEVVELGLGHRVVDVDGGDQQLAFLGHLVEAVDTGGGFFGHTLPLLDDFMEDAGLLLLDLL